MQKLPLTINVTKNKSLRTPVNESSNNQIKSTPKIPFVLHDFSPLEALNTLETEEFTKRIDDTVKIIYPPILEKSEHKLSLYTIIREWPTFGKPITTKITEEPNDVIRQKNINALSALLVRIRRFQTKQVTIAYLFNFSPKKKSIAIQQKLDSILSALKNQQISLIFNEPTDLKDGPAITIESTFKLITRTLIDVETQLKSLLCALHGSYHLNYCQNIFQTPILQDVIHDIAPVGFKGIQGDFYYVWRLLSMPFIFQGFNENQQKQWSTYFSELNDLFHFFTLADFPYDFSIFMTKKNTINLPFEKFITQTQMSNNTYSRLIHVMNEFLLLAWSQLLYQRLKKPPE